MFACACPTRGKNAASFIHSIIIFLQNSSCKWSFPPFESAGYLCIQTFMHSTFLYKENDKDVIFLDIDSDDIVIEIKSFVMFCRSLLNYLSYLELINIFDSIQFIYFVQIGTKVHVKKSVISL